MSCKGTPVKQENQKKLRCEAADVACTAVEAVASSLAGTKCFLRAVCEAGKRVPNAIKAAGLSGAVSAHLCLSTLMDRDFIPSLAQVIDRAWARVAAKRETPVEEAPVEAAPTEETVPAAVILEAVNEERDDNDGDEENDSFAGLNLSGLDFIDAKEEPEAYQALLLREQMGEIRIVTRYRRSFYSRLVQSQGDVQSYYSAIKNKLLSYKGVKGRVSWGNESFNKGRTYVAKVNAKAKTLYLYLALDPATIAAIEDGKYNITDMSDKKKYANVPVLMKIKGPRKLKQALELIDLLCAENLQLPPVKEFAEEDYTLPYQSTEELVEAGSIKMMVAGIPMSDLPNEATDGDVTSVLA